MFDVLRIKSSMSGKARRIIDAETSGLGCEARFVRARRDSNIGKRSRGSLSVRAGPSGFGGFRRVVRGGIAEVMLGVEEDGKTWDGFRLMRILASAWAASCEWWC